MFECWNGGLEGLGGLESLEFRGKRNRELELLVGVEFLVLVKSGWFYPF